MTVTRQAAAESMTVTRQAAAESMTVTRQAAAESMTVTFLIDGKYNIWQNYWKYSK